MQTRSWCLRLSKMKIFLLFLFVCTAEARLIKGDKCTDAQHNVGVCEPASLCPDTMDRLKLDNTSPTYCESSTSDKPVVCCVRRAAATAAAPPGLTTARVGAATTEYVPTVADYLELGEADAPRCAPIDPALTAPKTGRKAWDRCVDYQQLVFPCRRSGALGGGYSRQLLCHHNADQLVKNGVNASPAEFPHMTLLQYSDPSSDWFCGGALISDRFVLTAAHCIATANNVTVSHVVVGGLRRGEGVRRAVRRALAHPRYRAPAKYHDLALLELQEPLALSDTLVPACLPAGEAADDAAASAAGWGRLDYRGATADVLQKVVLDKFTNQECHVLYRSFNRSLPQGFDRKTQYCYGQRGGTGDTCEGDSGGPLHGKHDTLACMYVALGVTSVGRRCGDYSQPALYTRVRHYLDWIEGVVWPDH